MGEDLLFIQPNGPMNFGFHLQNYPGSPWRNDCPSDSAVFHYKSCSKNVGGPPKLEQEQPALFASESVPLS